MKNEPSSDRESCQRSENNEAKNVDPSESVEARVVNRRSPTCKSIEVLDGGPDILEILGDGRKLNTRYIDDHGGAVNFALAILATVVGYAGAHRDFLALDLLPLAVLPAPQLLMRVV